MIIADTSGIYASVDAAAAEHEAVTAILAEVDEPPLVTPFVVAEVDYLLTTRFGAKTAITFLQDVADGAYELVEFHRGTSGPHSAWYSATPTSPSASPTRHWSWPQPAMARLTCSRWTRGTSGPSHHSGV